MERGVRLNPARLSPAALLILPAAAFMLAAYVVPLAALVGQSFHGDGASLDLSQYVAIAGSRRIMAALGRTLRLAVVATALTFLLSYPIALYLVGAGRRVRTCILMLTFVSLAASLIVRNYGWLVVLADAGPVNRILLATGLTTTSVRLVYSEGATLVALVHYAMPFMILPIYGALIRLPQSGWEAAQALGASPWTALRTIILPQSMPGIYGGATLTFAIVISAFVTPLMLGSPSTAFISQVAADEFLVQLNFPRGAAILVMLAVVTFAALAVYGLVLRRGFRVHV